VAEQQLIYKSEIERIWKAQFDSLSRTDEPPLTEEDLRREARSIEKLNNERAGSLDREGSLAPDAPKSVLRIKRLVSRRKNEGTK